MPVWLPYLSTIIGALIQLAKLLIEMAKDKSGDKIKDCGLAIEEARKSGDVSKLTKIIEDMKRGNPCD